MIDPRKASVVLAAVATIGFDLGGNDTTVRWQSRDKPVPNQKKRAKVKAARKQRKSA